MKYFHTLGCRVLLLLLFVVAVTASPGLLTAAPPAQPAQPTSPAPPDTATLQAAFAAAAQEFGVPLPVLLSVSYNLTRWEDHHGAPSFAGGYGPMHLTLVPAIAGFDGRGDSVARTRSVNPGAAQLRTLETAAGLLGVSPDRLKDDPVQNIRGGAALLAAYARETVGGTPASVGDWYGAVAHYTGSQEEAVALDFANTVFATIQQGVTRTTSAGQQVTLTAQTVTPNKDTATPLHLKRSRWAGAECPLELPCEFIPAAHQMNDAADPTNYGNYDFANRPADGLDIKYIIIHGTEGSYHSVVDFFQDPQAYASSHYLVRSSDGYVAQMVRNKDVAWHAGNWYMNGHAIGIEHESFAIAGATWYSEPMYRASARLVRFLATQYNVPLDRAHILGSDEIPGSLPRHQAGLHWDPSAFWDWAHYMWLMDAPISATRAPENSAIVTINPDFSKNKPAFTYCYDQEASDCRAVPNQPANSIYLYTAPDFAAPLVTNPYLTMEPTLVNNWANKAVTGQQFYRVERRGEWEAIYFGGHLAWFYNPATAPKAIPGDGTLVTPRQGLAAIPVYSRAYPEATAYPADVPPQAITPIYTMPAGQRYVVMDEVQARFYWIPTFAPTLDASTRSVVRGETMYYRIFFNHRLAFVQASDVDVIPSPYQPVRRNR